MTWLTAGSVLLSFPIIITVFTVFGLVYLVTVLDSEILTGRRLLSLGKVVCIANSLEKKILYGFIILIFIVLCHMLVLVQVN